MIFDNHIPIYLQIMDIIKKEIILGIIKTGDKLDSVREFANELKVNPNTVQKAYQEMERVDLAYTKRGIGTFIIERDSLVSELKNEMSGNIIREFVKKMHEIGYSNKEILERIENSLSKGEK